MSEHPKPERADILGVGVSPLTMRDATGIIEGWIRTRAKHYVCVTGVHGVMECQRDPALRAIHNTAGMVTPDGVPLVWMSRRLGFHRVERVYGPDLMLEMTAISAERGYRHYYYGGPPGLAERLKRKLTADFPGLRVVGTHCPPFRPLNPEEDAAIVDEINAAQPDIVWVGLSTPKQERWMAAHVGRLDAPVLVGVGAAFDFLGGEKAQAPGWMRRNGLEWAFRMLTEPRRLAGRYIRNNPAFIVRAVRQLATAGPRAPLPQHRTPSS